MFLWFIKPKARKRFKYTYDYWIAKNIWTPFAFVRLVCIMAFWVCIPFLFIAFSDTILPFIWVTIIGTGSDFFCKLLSPDYIYF